MLKISRGGTMLLMPRELSWWVWLATGICLAVGLCGYRLGFYAAILISFLQTLVYISKETAAFTFPVQIRFAYTLLLISCQLPLLERLYWVPTVGAFALVFFGYCLMARMLSLLPWNRTEAMSLDLVWRTFFTPPLPGISITAFPRSNASEAGARWRAASRLSHSCTRAKNST